MVICREEIDRLECGEMRNLGPLLFACLAASGCLWARDEPSSAPLVVAVMLPRIDGKELPNLVWAQRSIAQAGGVAGGRPLTLEYVEADDDVEAAATRVASDPRYVAAIAPAGDGALARIAQTFIDARKPLVSTTSSSDELLRKFGGKGAIWRTRQSDVAAVEVLVRYAHGTGAKKVALLAPAEGTGATYFSWFGFFAREVGFRDGDVAVVPSKPGAPCHDGLKTALDGGADILFVAAGSIEHQTCVLDVLGRAPATTTRIVFADTGLDTREIERSPRRGIEGFSMPGSEAYRDGFRAQAADPDKRLAPHGAAEYSALLLLAYGLERSRGAGGDALIAGMKDAVSGVDEGAPGITADAIAENLARMRGGARPRLDGAAGRLAFEPEVFMDLAASIVTHWRLEPNGLVVDQSFDTSDPSFLTSRGVIVSAAAPNIVGDSSWTPSAPKGSTWAVIGSLSRGFANYRHESDAFAQYRLLREGGVAEDHIILFGPDEAASSAANLARGTIRNVPAGADLYAGAELDYRLGFTSADLVSILSGTPTASAPNVLSTDAAANVYVYLVGHGGEPGIAVGATTTADGVEAAEDGLTPSALRSALCAMAKAKRFRRIAIVIESCNGGVFGDAAFGGLEKGCDDGTPLDGVFLLAAATPHELSFAGGYDPALGIWVNDTFSRALADTFLAAPDASVAEAYVGVYRRVFGSHPSVYNVARAGRLSSFSLAEFLRP